MIPCLTAPLLCFKARLCLWLLVACNRRQQPECMSDAGNTNRQRAVGGMLTGVSNLSANCVVQAV